MLTTLRKGLTSTLSAIYCLLLPVAHQGFISANETSPFGEGWEQLDSAVTGNWWEKELEDRFAWTEFINVPRDEVVAFALYTHQGDILKLSAQFYPLMPGEKREARLEVQRKGKWVEIAEEPIIEVGWSAHFRIEEWDSKRNARYRVRHGENAVFEGLIRRNPIKKKEIVVASLSCNARHDRGDRDSIVRNLQKQDPDLVFFAGDQSYDHAQHTAAWLLWGEQFKEIIRDRPVVTIPDDHDIGQANLWGEGGIKAPNPQGPDGGYYYPPEYVNMVQRCQTWHLPDPFDPAPIKRDISVYYTALNVGGIDFAIIEDRKFKSGPAGKIPQMGPRPDHINDPSYDRLAVDLPGLKLLGDRQLHFLREWGQDWTNTEMKAVLSQTNFCGAVHLHGKMEGRLLADLDCNGWPQTGRNKALREIRRANAVHLAGDQHLAVVVQHGIDAYRDGPYSFVNPAIVNEVYGRWWWPEDEQAGANPIPNSPLSWTGDYEDGLGNKITMHAYANPEENLVRGRLPDGGIKNKADGYGLIRFNKPNQTITFECWPRIADLRKGDSEQYPGWPITITAKDGDGRTALGYLPEVIFKKLKNPVVQVIAEKSGDILYTRRIYAKSFEAPVYSEDNYTIKVGQDKPDRFKFTNVRIAKEDSKPISLPHM